MRQVTDSINFGAYDKYSSLRNPEQIKQSANSMLPGQWRNTHAEDYARESRTDSLVILALGKTE